MSHYALTLSLSELYMLKHHVPDGPSDPGEENVC